MEPCALCREAELETDGDKLERGLRSMVEHVAARWGQRGRRQQPGVYSDTGSAPFHGITLALGNEGGLR